MNSYTTETFTATLPIADAEAYRRIGRFEQLCSSCPGYGRRWGCPPQTAETLAIPGRYEVMELVGVKITPSETGLPLAEADAIIESVRRRIEPAILQHEAACDGFAMLFTGRCYHCGDRACTRPEGRPCRHPQLVRPSLEAMGYDVGALAERYLGQKLVWSSDGTMPPYLFIVGVVLKHPNS